MRHANPRTHSLTLLQRSTVGADRRTNGRTPYRYIDPAAYYASSVNYHGADEEFEQQLPKCIDNLFSLIGANAENSVRVN